MSENAQGTLDVMTSSTSNKATNSSATIDYLAGKDGMRRGLGTNLYRLGVPDKVIQAILRHSNVTVTLGYYVKPQSEDVIANPHEVSGNAPTSVIPLALRYSITSFIARLYVSTAVSTPKLPLCLTRSQIVRRQ